MTKAVVVGLQTGRREANKREKLNRIRRAARDVFLRKGFEAATVREIAAASDVAFGTLFLYAKDKRDLLLLIFEEDLPLLSERAFRRAKPELAFIDQLMAYFTEIYTFFSSTPQLSRDMLREITFSGGIVATRLWASVQGNEQHLAMLVARAQSNGEISSGITPDLAAHVIFSLYRIEIRFCLDDDNPDVSGSLGKLRRAFEVLFIGLQPRVAMAMGSSPRLPERKPVTRRSRER